MKKNNLIVNFIFLLIGMYIFISIVVLGVGGIFFRQSTGSWGDIFSLGQFLADICVMPFAILAIYLTLQELRKLQEHAELNIGWETPEGVSKEFSENRPLSANFYSPSIVLSNIGTTPSIHYQITLEVPIETGRTKMVDHNWKGDRQGNYQKFIFTSASNFVSFPNAPYINLGKIEFTETNLLPIEIVIKYYIASDKDDYQSGKLIIKLIENESSEKLKK